MKTNKLIAFAFLLWTSAGVQGAANDNEVLLDQSGDTLTLTIDQIGYGNKLCGTISSGTCATDWIFTGSGNTFDIDMIGNLNQIFGPTLLDSTTVDLKLTGSSNIWDWNIGYGGSADSSDVDVDISGSSNTFDFDWAYFDIFQQSGTCPTGISGCYGVINADFDSENATVNIKQQDTAD